MSAEASFCNPSAKDYVGMGRGGHNYRPWLRGVNRRRKNSLEELGRWKHTAVENIGFTSSYGFQILICGWRCFYTWVAVELVFVVLFFFSLSFFQPLTSLQCVRARLLNSPFLGTSDLQSFKVSWLQALQIRLISSLLNPSWAGF